MLYRRYPFITQEVIWEEYIELYSCPTELWDKAIELLHKHSNIWSDHFAKVRAPTHLIQLRTGNKTLRSILYRQDPASRQMNAKEIPKIRKAGFIEPTNSGWASPLLFVPKSDGLRQFCVDYCWLNTATATDPYPFRPVDEFMDSMWEAAVFFMLYYNRGYWKSPFQGKDEQKTFLITHMGTSRFNRVPFSWKYAPMTFYRSLAIIVSRARYQKFLLYLYCLIVFSMDFESHLQHLDELLSLLNGAGFSLKLNKCKFFKRSVRYLDIYEAQKKSLSRCINSLLSRTRVYYVA